MKKLIAVILSVILVFLTGCSSELLWTKETAGFTELNIKKDYVDNAYSLCSKGDYLFFCTNIWYDKDGNICENLPDDETDSSDYKCIDYLVKFNAKRNKLVKELSLEDCPVQEIWGIELGEDDNIVVYSDAEKKNAVYDKNLKFIETTERNVDEDDFRKQAEKSKFYSPTRSTVNEGISYCLENDTQFTYFFDSPDILYAYKTDAMYQISAFYNPDKLILNEHFSDNSDAVSFSVDDYRNSTEINSATIDPKIFGYDYCATSATAIGDQYVFCIENFGYNDNSEKYENKLFAWNFHYEPTNKKIPVRAYTYDDMVTGNAKKISDIKEKYGIDIHINESHEGIENSVNCDEEIDILAVSEDLNHLIKFLETLPDGMIQEIYSGFYFEDGERSGIRLDIVYDITYDADAFADIYSEPMEVCFEANAFSMKTISHEFMHLFNARIYDYINHTGEFNMEWENINDTYRNDVVDEDNHEYQYDEKYFVSDYAATNNEEDLAETFSYIYNSVGEERMLCKNEIIKKKVDLLIDMIHKAYPSVQAAKQVYWEK